MPSRTLKSNRAKKAAPTTRRGAKPLSAARTRSVRLGMRLERRAKTLIERATSLTGQTVTDFAVSAFVESAVMTIERHERLVFSDRDRDRLLVAPDPPARALPALIKAARLHAEATRENRHCFDFLRNCSPPKHQREGFDYGKETLNRYLRQYAFQN